MNPVVVTLGTGSNPTDVDARNHAIKNCASVILGLALTMERHVDPAARRRVTQLIDASRRMAKLVAPPARSSEVAAEPMHVEDVLRLVVDRLGPVAESSSVQLAVDCGGGSIVGDGAELVEALYNLASNALQASPPKSTVRITTRSCPEAGHQWTVQDEGCGIPPSVLPRLGTVGMTTRKEGSGLGFALAMQAVSRHHGTIRVESVAGRGTTMTVWLPASPQR